METPEPATTGNPTDDVHLARLEEEMREVRTRFRFATAGAAAAIGFGMLFYRFTEDMTWVDAFYFCVVSLATVGYGDIVPVTDAGKIFTSFYILVGFGIIATFATTLVKRSAAKRAYRDRLHRLESHQ